MLRKLLQALIFIIFVFVVTPIGGGLPGEEYRLWSSLLIAATGASWLLLRFLHGWRWYPTPLDGVMILWGVIFALSLVTNIDLWRRIAIALWFVGLYILVWYGLHDLLAHRAITPILLTDALLATGLLIILVGYLQSYNWTIQNLPLMTSGAEPLALPRPGSLLGNPNVLSGFLIMLIPIALWRTLQPRNPLERGLMALYTLSAIGLLFLTFSRGGWLGLAVGLLVFVLLVLAQNDLLHPARWRKAWQSTGLVLRSMLIIASGIGLGVMLVAGLIFVSSLTSAGRSAQLRIDIWETAITVFTENPLVGRGLFTFSYSFMGDQPIPPVNPHSHTHNAILQILAELGIAGLVIFLITAFVLLRAMWRNWQNGTNEQKLRYGAVIASCAAIATHHMTDFISGVPSIALTELILIVVATYTPPVQTVGSKRQIAFSAGLPVLVVILSVTGLVSTRIYADYVNVVTTGLQTGNYSQAADALDDVIAGDPYLPLYRLQQAFLYGLDATDGDPQAARNAVVTYQQFLAMEPYHAVAWANLSALHWQLGEPDAAINAMERAHELAPPIWQYSFALGMYAETLGDTAVARDYYNSITAEQPVDIVLYPAWTATPLRREIAAQTTQSERAQVAIALVDNDVQRASTLWEALDTPPTSDYWVLGALIAVQSGDLPTAEGRLLSAARVVNFEPDWEAWVHLGRAHIALEQGDEVTALTEIEAANASIAPSLAPAEFHYAENYALGHFFRLGIVRQYLPQLYYPTADPVLVYMLNAVEAALPVQ